MKFKFLKILFEIYLYLLNKIRLFLKGPIIYDFYKNIYKFGYKYIKAIVLYRFGYFGDIKSHQQKYFVLRTYFNTTLNWLPDTFSSLFFKNPSATTSTSNINISPNFSSALFFRNNIPRDPFYLGVLNFYILILRRKMFINFLFLLILILSILSFSLFYFNNYIFTFTNNIVNFLFIYLEISIFFPYIVFFFITIIN